MGSAAAPGSWNIGLQRGVDALSSPYANCVPSTKAQRIIAEADAPTLICNEEDQFGNTPLMLVSVLPASRIVPSRRAHVVCGCIPDRVHSCMPDCGGHKCKTWITTLHDSPVQGFAGTRYGSRWSTMIHIRFVSRLVCFGRQHESDNYSRP